MFILNSIKILNIFFPIGHLDFPKPTVDSSADLAISPLSNCNVWPGYHSFARFKKPIKIAVHMQSPSGNQLWFPGPSLWSLITEHVPGSELPKIRAALGHSLVDMYTEVHTEVEMWHKMWQESQGGGNHCSRSGTPLPRQQAPFLADPPAVKELVRAEVKMLLQTLMERDSREGRDSKELLFWYKPETVNYALGHLDSCYSNCPLPEVTANRSRPSSQCSVQSSAEEEIEAVREKLNVTDIDRVADHLKSILMEECKGLNTLLQHLKRNIKQKYKSKCEFDQSEPSLAELSELRAAIQMDLELYPSSFSASPTPSSPRSVKKLKNRLRLSAGQRASDETLRALTTASNLRPHPPLCHSNPKPPAGPPLTKTSASVKPVNTSSLSSIHHRSTSKIPICTNITTPVHVNSHFTTDQIMIKSNHLCSLCSEHDRASLHRRTPNSSPSFQMELQRNSSIHEAHLSSHCSIHSLSKECDLSFQTERKSSPVWKSSNIDITPPPIPALCEAGSYSCKTSDLTVKTKAQNGNRKSSCRGSFVSVTVQTGNDRNKRSHGGFTNQPKSVQEGQMELEFTNFYQPVPPARLTT
uniref:Coiled-coil domain containing 24 n=1 Tax=Monopterus albus TaxID=43700 RepID=A0A3Q3KJM6_MONAL|nr:coiled-coil domain-containing protein 24 [Monopterus albus]